MSNASNIHTEQTFEESIEHSLLTSGGFQKGLQEDFDRKLALDRLTVISFLQVTQSKAWEKISKVHGADVETKVINRLVRELDLRGILDVYRKGFTDYGVKFKMAYFRPETALNPESERLYNLNQLKIIRQLHYDPQNRNSLDIVLFLNGLPVVTMELKNQFTGQDVSDAKKQFAYDRDPKAPIFQFKKRALVHFAVDTDTVYMTTRLKGKNTKYLPFNLGHNNGAGNPPNPNGYRTSYLWENILAKNSLMDIIGRFLHIEVEEYDFSGQTKKKEKLIFPRFHQLDVVRKLTADAKKRGSGKNYLIQHSAGSGKSNSIAWLSYRLASLHDANDKRVFDSVIVVTDRRILDTQLQNTIYQFEHKQGVVQKIDKHSGQLAEALEKGSNIIITTLQKFPFVLDKIGELPTRNYAVIIDEVHSSQGGEASRKMKEVLAASSLEEAEELERTTGEEEDIEDEIRKTMMTRGRQPNLSFFGFTATPKAKTLEVFGESGTDKKPRPFHLYSMKQAIEEGFIHDVLKNYTTYKTYFKLSKAIEGDPEVNKRKAAIAIARFLSLHPHNLAQKTEVMVEHFQRIVSKKIGGKAKAMLVTGSRLHAVRYYQEFKRYITKKGYNIGVLVAFSGTVKDPDIPGEEYRETELNKFWEKQLPKKFDTSDYRLLLVADKYQTGFDQPLLHTMYVDKKLSGVKAVQTLSRLNRINPGKEDTFVLDFVNDEQIIYEAFQPYYELTTVEETTDPNHLYDLKTKIEEPQVIWPTEMDNFFKYYFKSFANLTPQDQARLNSYIDPAVERFKALPDEDEKENFKHAVFSFTRLYSFLSQIIPFQDVDLEKLYTYGRFLLKKLPKRESERYALHDEVALEYYRLQKIRESHQIVLESHGEDEITGVKDAGIRYEIEEKVILSELIDVLNQRFGTEFNEGDRLFFEQIEAELVADENLESQAKSNTLDNFKFGFEEVFLNILIDRMDQNQEIFTRMMDEPEFSKLVKEHMAKKVYKRLTEVRP